MVIFLLRMWSSKYFFFYNQNEYVLLISNCAIRVLPIFTVLTNRRAWSHLSEILVLFKSCKKISQRFLSSLTTQKYFNVLIEWLRIHMKILCLQNKLSVYLAYDSNRSWKMKGSSNFFPPCYLLLFIWLYQKQCTNNSWQCGKHRAKPTFYHTVVENSSSLLLIIFTPILPDCQFQALAAWRRTVLPTREKLVTVSLLLDKLEMPVQDLVGEKG